MHAAVRAVYRATRAVRIIALDGRIPRPLRVLFVIGLMPVPGPLDEAALVIAALPLLLFYRATMRDAWRRAGDAAQLSPRCTRRRRSGAE